MIQENFEKFTFINMNTLIIGAYKAVTVTNSLSIINLIQFIILF